MTHLIDDCIPFEDMNDDPLGRLATLSYGSGHMLNDITAACWFTYLLLFLTDLGLTPRDAATVMLSGQIADAFATIFVGELIDRFGHFKLWHAGGSFLVSISFSSVFGACIPCKILGTNSSGMRTIGYSTFAAIFNVGWAVTQVSHMSMVNCITLNPSSRVALASCRNAFTMVANLTLYAVALAVFSVYSSKYTADVKIQSLLAFYVIKDLGMNHSSKALVPAIIYISSFIVSVILQEIRWNGERLKACYTAGAILWMFSGAGLFILPGSMHNLMYILSIVIGAANALMTVSGISMESVLVGNDLNGCAFVYGSLSFLDKLSCGIAIYILESYQEPQLATIAGQSYSVTRYGLGVLPATLAFLSVVVTYTMKLPDTRSRTMAEPLLA